jgi:G3E family GTPase
LIDGAHSEMLRVRPAAMDTAVKEAVMNGCMLAPGGRAPIPVTMVGGPAGGGKTTLLRRLLGRNDGRRVAVVLDHPAALRIDGSSVSESDGTALLLNNGSVCLGLDGEIATAVAWLQAHPGVSDHVVIEAPPNVSMTRMSGYAYMPGFRPAGNVIVVSAPDVVHAQNDKRKADTAVGPQFRHADLVVLNRVDGIGASARRTARQWLQERATRCRLVESEHCCVPAAMILGIGMTHAPAHTTLGEWTPNYAVDIEPRRSRITQPRNNDDYRAWLLTTRRPIDARAFRAWVEALPDSIVRGDGVLRLGSETRHGFHFHFWGSRWSLTADEPVGHGATVSWVSLVGLPSSARRGSSAGDHVGTGRVLPDLEPLRVQPHELALARHNW